MEEECQTDSVLEKIKAEFIKRYPHNYCGEPELGGASCTFSLNEVLEIIDKYIGRKQTDTEIILEDIKRELIEKTKHISRNEYTDVFDDGILQAIFLINSRIDRRNDKKEE